MRCGLATAGTFRSLLVILAVAVLSLSCAVRSPDVALQVPPAPESVSSSPGVRLFREVLRFRIADGTVEGLGFYYFRNPDTVARAFPAAISFVVANWQGPPRNLQFMHVSPDSNENLNFVWLEKNYPLADLFIGPRGTYCLRVGWEQELSENRFVYRFRRKAPWNRQRDHLRLTLSVPQSFRDVSSNYRFSHRFKSQSRRDFVMVCDDFEPSEDFVVSWER